MEFWPCLNRHTYVPHHAFCLDGEGYAGTKRRQNEVARSTRESEGVLPLKRSTSLPGMKPGGVGWAAGIDFRDQEALGLIQIEAPRQVGADILKMDADPAHGRRYRIEQVAHGIRRVRGRDGETKAV